MNIKIVNLKGLLSHQNFSDVKNHTFDSVTTITENESIVGGFILYIYA